MDLKTELAKENSKTNTLNIVAYIGNDELLQGTFERDLWYS